MFSEKNISQRTVFIVTGFIALAAFIVAVKDMFFFDEDIFITQLNSAFMQQGWQRSVLVKQFFKAENLLFGKSPAGYHIVSVVLHVLNAVLGVFLFKKLLQFLEVYKTFPVKTGILPVFFALFLFSGIHSEPLSYILAQGILLFSLFAQLSLLFFIAGAGGKNRAFTASLVCFILSLFCYEISWMLPAVVLVMMLFSNRQNKVQWRRGIRVAFVFWLVLFLWFAIKVQFISRSLVADYENVTAGTVSVMKICRNAIVLFARNFIPPAKNTIVFVTAAIALVIVLLSCFVKLRKTSKGWYRCSLLLASLVIFTFLPAAVFGIDSHDSESERYIYFSSLFATMLLAVLLTVFFKNGVVLKFVAAGLCLMYALVLFTALYNYRTAGVFSEKYLDELHQRTKGAGVVYTFNQPAQFKGALILRALTRLPQKTGDNVTVLAEYMRYLYNDTGTVFVTVSAVEILKPYRQITVSEHPLGDAPAFFPGAATIISSLRADSNHTAIAGLRSDTLFIFR